MDNHFDVPNMPKSYLDQKLQHEIQLFSFPVFFNFVKKILKFMTHKLPSWDHFWPFFGQLHENLSQKRCADSHFEMLSGSKSYLDQEL